MPADPLTCAWPPSLPSVPTSRATRVTSEANPLSWSTIVLIVFFSSRISPLHIHRDLLRQVAVGHRRGHLGDVAHLVGEVAGHQVHAVGQVLPGARDALTCAWPPSLPSVPTSRATRVTSEANALSWSTIVLIVFFSSRISPLHVRRDLLRQVAVGHRRRHRRRCCAPGR